MPGRGKTRSDVVLIKGLTEVIHIVLYVRLKERLLGPLGRLEEWIECRSQSGASHHHSR